MSDMNDAETIAEHAIASVGPRDIDGHPFAIIPQGFKVEDLEHLREAPRSHRPMLPS